MTWLRCCLVALLCALLLAPLAGGALAVGPREQQWGLAQIGAAEAWQATRAERVVVAVVDTGVDLTHPDLAPRLHRDGDGRVVGRDEVAGGDHPQDENGHGTLVAGVAAADADAGVHGEGIAGVAPRARIMPVRVLDGGGRGSLHDLDAGIRWAVDNGADVINLSLESAVPLPGDVLATGPDDAVDYAWERGVPVVAAAGNSGTPFTDYDPSTPVLLVGASDRQDRRAAFSDTGRSDMVLAPGVEVISSACDPCGEDAEPRYATASGTSMAAPHAAGALALLLATGLDHEQAVARLRDTAVEVEGGMVGVSSGHGRIDAAAAVATTVRGQGDDDGAGGRGDLGSQDQATGTEAAPAAQDGSHGSRREVEQGATPQAGADGSPGDAEQSESDADPPVSDEGQPSTGQPATEAGEGEQAVEGRADGQADDGRRDDDAEGAGGRGAHGEAAAADVPSRSERAQDGPHTLEGIAAGMVAASLAAVLWASRRFDQRRSM